MTVPAEKPKKVAPRRSPQSGDRRASGAFAARSGRRPPREARLRAPSPLPQPRLQPARRHVGLCRRGDLRRADVGQRLRHAGRHQVRARLDPQGGRGGRAVPRPLPRRPAADPRRRRPGRPASRGQGRDRLCRHRADRSRPRLVPGADEGLPVASRGHDLARLLRAAGDQRHLSGAGLPLRRQRLRLPVPSRGHARDEADLDAHGRRAPEDAGRPAARRASLHAPALRSADRPLDQRLPRSLAGDRQRRLSSPEAFRPALPEQLLAAE